MNLKYEVINDNNILLATSIQFTIFPLGCAYEHYRYSIRTEYKDSIYYIVKWNEIPVGITGLYLNNVASNDSIWLGWYGILPEFRSKGIGRQALIDTIEKAKKYNRKYLRLYTIDDGTTNKEFGNNIARPLYRSIMHMYEKYKNDKDYNYDNNCLIYSYNLSNKELQPWNNRFANIQDDVEKEEIAIKNWNKKYKILILNSDNSLNDIKLATTFREDGHEVIFKNKNLNNDKFDFIIDKNKFSNKNNLDNKFLLNYKEDVYQKIIKTR